MEQVSSSRLRDSRFENPVVDVEKRLPYLPQDQRYGSEPYLDIPPRQTVDRLFVFLPNKLFVALGSFASSLGARLTAGFCY